MGSAEQVSQDEVESFKRDGRIPKGDKFIPVLNGEITVSNVGNMHEVRDTGCSTIIVREDLVAENQKLNEKVTLILANSSALNNPVAILINHIHQVNFMRYAGRSQTMTYLLETLMGLEMQII